MYDVDEQRWRRIFATGIKAIADETGFEVVHLLAQYKQRTSGVRTLDWASFRLEFERRKEIRDGIFVCTACFAGRGIRGYGDRGPGCARSQ